MDRVRAPVLELGAVVVASLGLAACGGSYAGESPKSVAPSPVEEAPPPAPTADRPPIADRDVHIEDALSELREAEHALDRELEKPPPPARPKTPRPTPTPRQGTPPPPSDERSCHVACVALASMRRSADYVCKLAGSGDARCVDADARARRAESKVTSTCGACEAAPLSSSCAPSAQHSV